MSTWLFMPVDPTDEMIEASGLEPKQAIDVWEKMAMASPRPVTTAGGEERRKALDSLLMDLVAAGSVLGAFQSDSISITKDVTVKIDSIKAQIADMLL